jgi:hypothetical protein
MHGTMNLKAGIQFMKSTDIYLNILNFKIQFPRIYNIIIPYLEISIAPINATTSDLSFVTVKSSIPMSATPL